MAKSRRMMRAFVFQSPGIISLESKPVPVAGPMEAIVKVHLTSICSDDLNTVRGLFPVTSGLTLGHEAVGVIHELGEQVSGYALGQRVLVSAATPCGQCLPCLNGQLVHCANGSHGRIGKTLDGTQAEYVRIPFAQANLAVMPDCVSDESGLLLCEVASSGFAAAERGGVQLGDHVAVFGLGPVGLCACLGAKLRGAAKVMAIDSRQNRLQMYRQFGATDLFDPSEAINEVFRHTKGTGADVAIEAQEESRTFETALRVLRPGGTLSSVGMLFQPLMISDTSFENRAGNHTIVNSTCSGGKGRMERLLRLVENKRIDLTPMLTHRFPLEESATAYEMLVNQKQAAIKVAIQLSPSS